MNLPNKLTISRILLTIAFVIFLFWKGFTPKVLALFMFLLASLTDFLDGFIAKRSNQVTDFGKLMDPVADKVLVLSAFISFVELKLISGWMVAIIIIREVLVTTLRLFALTKGKVISADGGGKHKTISQIGTIFFILLYNIFSAGGESRFGFWSVSFSDGYRYLITILMTVTVLLTVLSGVSYMIKNRGVYINEKT